MTPIKIEFDKGFKVSQGDRYADMLTFGEMMEVVVALTREQQSNHPISWMKTQEEWDAYEAQVRARAEKYRQGENGITEVDFEEEI